MEPNEVLHPQRDEVECLPSNLTSLLMLVHIIFSWIMTFFGSLSIHDELNLDISKYGNNSFL